MNTLWKCEYSKAMAWVACTKPEKESLSWKNDEFFIVATQSNGNDYRRNIDTHTHSASNESKTFNDFPSLRSFTFSLFSLVTTESVFQLSISLTLASACKSMRRRRDVKGDSSRRPSPPRNRRQKWIASQPRTSAPRCPSTGKRRKWKRNFKVDRKLSFFRLCFRHVFALEKVANFFTSPAFSRSAMQ